jgi:hypothetical protein
MYEELTTLCKCSGWLRCAFSPMITIRHHYSRQARMKYGCIIATRAMNLSTLMRCPFPFAPEWLRGVFLVVPVCLQTRLVVGHSGTQLVVAGAGWTSVLCSKAQACFMERLQTLAATALEVPEELCPFTLTAVGSAVPSG